MAADLEGFKIVIGIVLAIEFVVGVFCNVAVLVLPTPKWCRSMETGNKLMKSLHIIDLIICVCLIPLTFAVLMCSPHIIETLCFFHESLISFATSGGCVSVLFISLDRYASISSSLSSKSAKQAKLFTVLIWSISFVGFILPWINMMVQTVDTEKVIAAEENLTIVDCEHLVTSYNEYNIYEIFGIGIFFLTCIGIIVCYGSIFKVAKGRQNIGDQNTEYNQFKAEAKKKREKRALKITLSLVGSFMLCWGLFIIVSLIEMVAKPSTAMNAVHLVSLCIVFLSTIVHPTLYRFIHDDIRCIKKNKSDHTETTDSVIHTQKSRNAIHPSITEQVVVQSASSQISPVRTQDQSKVDIFTAKSTILAD